MILIQDYRNIDEKIASIKAQIEVLEWDATSGAVPTYYAYQEIDILEHRLDELVLLKEDAEQERIAL